MPKSTSESLALVDRLRRAAIDEGFSMFGVAPAVEASGFHRLTEWLDSGHAGSMDYIAKRIDAYRHPSGVLPGVKSLVMLAYPYPRTSGRDAAIQSGVERSLGGRIARYAWPGTDYHDVIHPKLKRLCRLIRETVPEANARGVVDTAPLLEREFASLAGLGWQGKNTLLINKHDGSYFFLASVLSTVELPPSTPHTADHCGSCTACLDACPTDAFPQAGVLDATRCVSYLTIENRDAIPVSLRQSVGQWAFGCDICQEVCPWNRKPSRRDEADNHEPPAFDRLNLAELFALDETEFRARFRKTPLWRTRRRGVLRNAAIVLGNQAERSTVPALSIGLKDEDAMVRQTCAWALGQIATGLAIRVLESAAETENDPDTREQICVAIANATNSPENDLQG